MTASGSEKPSLKLNGAYGLSTLFFSGDDELDITSMTNGMSGNQHHTIFVVLKNTKDNGDNNTFFKYGTVASSGQQSRLDYHHSHGDLRHSWYGGNRAYPEQEERTLGHTTRINFVYSGGGTSSDQLRVNSGTDYQTTVDASITPNLPATTTMTFGGGGGSE